MIETFITVLAYFGVVIGLVGTLIIWHTWHELNNTTYGELRQALADIEGKKIVTRSPVGSIVLFIISLAWLIATDIS